MLAKIKIIFENNNQGFENILEILFPIQTPSAKLNTTTIVFMAHTIISLLNLDLPMTWVGIIGLMVISVTPTNTNAIIIRYITFAFWL